MLPAFHLPLGLPLGSDPGPPGTGAAQHSPPGNALADYQAEAPPTWGLTLTHSEQHGQATAPPRERQPRMSAVQGK